MSGDSTQSRLSHADRWLDGTGLDEGEPALGLSIAWCLSDPERLGEVALVPARGRRCLGRGEESEVRFVRVRPSGLAPTAPLEGRLLSRRQLELEVVDGRLRLVNVGACALKVGGVVVREATLEPGAVFELDRQVVFVVVRRSPIAYDGPLDEVPFAKADVHGIVGESDAAWALRSRLRFLARRREPALVCGPSGSGKELAARALHASSSSSRGPFVARNAATLPESLVDAELFGNLRDYPNPGMPERPGLVGAADQGTLFLDEIGELPEPLQAHLLRVLDRGGEYQRLGESRTRRSVFRFVAATNRDPSSLKHDLLARLPLRVELPGLTERPEDVPLLARHLLEEVRQDPELEARLFDGRSARLAPDLVAALASHRYTHHVRELHSLLWTSIETSPGRALLLTPDVRARLDHAAPEPVDELDEPAVRAALAATGGNVTAAAKRLGLSSRFVLYRFLRKLGGLDAPTRVP